MPYLCQRCLAACCFALAVLAVPNTKDHHDVLALPHASADDDVHTYLRSGSHLLPKGVHPTSLPKKVINSTREHLDDVPHPVHVPKQTKLPRGMGPHGWLLGTLCVILTLAFMGSRNLYEFIVGDEDLEAELELDLPQQQEQGTASTFERAETTQGQGKQRRVDMRRASTILCHNSSLIHVDLVKAKFDKLADRSELDFYSCLGLAFGRYKFNSKMVKFLPGLLCVSCMQVLLGVLLLAVQYENNNGGMYYSQETSVKFRIVGFVLFLFASWQISGAMDDECRDVLLYCMHGRNISGYYKWPILAGEILNKGIGLILVLILFMIFCQTRRPTSLLMNCIAVNFVVEVDNILVSQDDAEEASDNLDPALDAWNESGVGISPGLAQRSVLFVNESIRIAFPFVTCFLVLVFALGNNDSLCQRMKEIDPYPFCVGVSM